MKINNYVKIRGAYVPASSLTKEEWLEVSGTILDRFAGKLGGKALCKRLDNTLLCGTGRLYGKEGQA